MVTTRAEGVLFRQENARVVDFGASCALGWVDEEKVGRIYGDLRGIGKITYL